MGAIEPWLIARWKARVELLLTVIELLFTACAMSIASAVLATAIPYVRLSVRLSVRPSVCLSVTRRSCVKTTARSTVQFPTLDSKMCLHLESKKGATLTLAITLSILDGFAKFFHCCKEQ